MQVLPLATHLVDTPLERFELNQQFIVFSTSPPVAKRQSMFTLSERPSHMSGGGAMSANISHSHCNDVIMSAMASQITRPTIVYSTVYSGANQRKHQSCASLAFVQGIHRWPVNPPHKYCIKTCRNVQTKSNPINHKHISCKSQTNSRQ